MKLASLKEGGRDGALIVVSYDLTRGFSTHQIAPTMQAAIENWQHIFPELEMMYVDLNEGKLEGFPIKKQKLASPFPRAYQWLDGSAYLSHVERVRKARGAEIPENLYTDPLMYQGGSDYFLGPADPIVLPDTNWGLDFEAEVVVVTDDVPQGVTTEEAVKHIQLVMLVNDISL
ncbi:MAG: fumarylacetoacetate hydrolase family protein, partial [Gammaproteobacteria bacterium]